MARILIHSAGSLGDLNPFRRIAAELVRRGHSVVFFTLSDYLETLRVDGIEAVSIPFQVSVKDPVLARRILDPHEGGEFLFRELILNHVRDNYFALEKIVKDVDLLISGSLAFSCALIHEKKQIPWVSVTLQPYLYMSETDFPVLPVLPGLSSFTSRSVLLARVFKKLIRFQIDRWSKNPPELWMGFLKELGLSPAKNIIFDCSTSPELDLAVFSPLLGKPQKDWSTSSRIIGFIQEPLDSVPLSTETSRFLNAGNAPVVFTQGSAAVLNARDFFLQALEWSRKSSERVMMVCGDWAEELRTLNPDSTRIHITGPEPYQSLFHRARLVVHQGGVGTTGETLRAGVPQLVAAAGQDQYDQGERVRRLGCGEWVPQHQFVLNVDRWMERVLQPAIVERAHEVGQQIQREKGLQNAIQAIEDFLTQKKTRT